MTNYGRPVDIDKRLAELDRYADEARSLRAIRAALQAFPGSTVVAVNFGQCPGGIQLDGFGATDLDVENNRLFRTVKTECGDVKVYSPSLPDLGAALEIVDAPRFATIPHKAALIAALLETAKQRSL